MSKPIFRPDPRFFTPVIFPYCQKCGYGHLSSLNDYCPHCGEPLEWDGEMPVDDEAIQKHMKENDITWEEIDNTPNKKVGEKARKWWDKKHGSCGRDN